jgi:hypothetical protein
MTELSALPLGAQFLNLQEVTQMLRVDRATASLYVRRGQIKGKYDAASRTWKIRRDEVERFMKERGGVGMTRILDRIDEHYIDAVAKVGIAASRYLDQSARLETYRGTTLSAIPDSVLHDFQERLDLLVDTCQHYRQLATLKATLGKIVLDDVKHPSPHPEDRLVEDPAPREQEA